MAKKKKRAFIRITAKIDGFRRAGMAHYGTAEYPVEKFGSELIKTLCAEPNLETEIINVAVEGEEAAGRAEDTPPPELVGALAQDENPPA